MKSKKEKNLIIRVRIVVKKLSLRNTHILYIALNTQIFLNVNTKQFLFFLYVCKWVPVRYCVNEYH